MGYFFFMAEYKILEICVRTYWRNFFYIFFSVSITFFSQTTKNFFIAIFIAF